MKKLLLLLSGCLFAGSAAFAQDETEALPIGNPTNYVLTVQAMDAATEYGDEQPSVSYFLQPISATKYSTLGLEDIILKGYTDPVKNKSAKYIYSIKYYKAGYKTATEDNNGDAPVGNADNSYTIFISGDEPDIKLSVCAVWPDGKNYVEWIHNFSNIVATDANVYGFVYVSGNELPETYTYYNKFAKTDDFGGTNFSKFYTKTDTNNANISTNFLKGNSQSGLVYLSSESAKYNNETESGIFKFALDYATGEITLTPCMDEFNLFIDNFTTFNAPFSYTLAEGTKAFTLVFDKDEACLKAKPIVGNSVDANTPVIIKSTVSGEYTFTINDEPTFTPVLEPNQAKKAYIPDTRMDNNVLVGVNHPHWIDTYSGTQEINNRYTLSGKTFTKNKALSTKKNYDNAIVPQYTCYVEIPSDVDVAPETLEIVFLEDEEPVEKVLYVHFTDKDGNYSFTHEDTLTWIEQDKTYYYEYFDMPKANEGDEYVYFVFSDTKPAASEVSLLSVVSASDWADYGTVYHATADNGAAILQDSDEVKPFSAKPEYTHTIQLKLSADDTPLSIDIVNLNVPTGVVSIESPIENGVTYNIFGQKVDESYKGIVIRNGKKFIQR